MAGSLTSWTGCLFFGGGENHTEWLRECMWIEWFISSVGCPDLSPVVFDSNRLDQVQMRWWCQSNEILRKVEGSLNQQNRVSALFEEKEQQNNSVERSLGVSMIWTTRIRCKWGDGPEVMRYYGRRKDNLNQRNTPSPITLCQRRVCTSHTLRPVRIESRLIVRHVQLIEVTYSYF